MESQKGKIYIPAWIFILDELKLNGATYSSLLAKKLDLTYSHVVQTIIKLELKGLVETIKDGRKKEISVTEKGNKVADNCNQLIMRLK